MAGIPKEVINRANSILKKLEGTNQQQNLLSFNIEKKNNFDDISNNANIMNYINNIDLEKLSPTEAISELVKLKKMVGSL